MSYEDATCGNCTERTDRCEQECMMEAATKEIEYFEDEELDRFQGRSSDSYSDDEIEEFRYVLYTMKAHEVADWNRSLVLRGINIPDPLKDEVALLLEHT